MRRPFRLFGPAPLRIMAVKERLFLPSSSFDRTLLNRQFCERASLSFSVIPGKGRIRISLFLIMSLSVLLG